MKRTQPWICTDPRSLAAACFLALVLQSAPGSAQAIDVEAATDTAKATARKLSAKEVQDRLARLESDSDLDATEKDKRRDIYKQALEQVRIAEEWARKAATTEAGRQSDPAEIAKLKAELAVAARETTVAPPADASVATLEQLLTDASTQLKAEQAELAFWTNDPKRRREETPRRIAALNERLAKIDQELAAIPDMPDALDAAQARRTFLVAARQSIDEELNFLEQDRLRYEVNADLTTTKRDMAARKVAQAESRVKQYRELVDEQRKQDAAEQARNARWAAAAAFSQVKPLADEIAKRAEERGGPDGLPAKIERARAENETLQAELVQLDAQYNSVRERIAAAGLTDAMGLLLQKQQDDLPNLRQHRQRLRTLQSETSQIHASLLEWEDERADLFDLEAATRREMAAIAPRTPDDERDDIERAVREMLTAKRAYLEAQIADAKAYFNLLALDLVADERQLIARTEAYQQFISENILWIRSAAPLAAQDVGRAWETALRIVRDPQWNDVLRTLWRDLQTAPLVWLAALLLLAPLVASQGRLRRRILALGEQTTKDYTVGIGPTVEVLLLTVLISVVWPATMGFFAWRLTAPVDAAPLAHDLSRALATTAIVFFSTELVRQCCRRKGLGDVHFHWNDGSLAIMRRNLRWGLVLGLPITLVVALVDASDREPDKASLGRLTYIAGMILSAVIARRILHPTRGVLRPGAIDSSGWIARTVSLWYWLGIGAPLAMATIASLGYFYTALHLSRRLQATVWLVLTLVLVHSFALRWLLVARRKLAIKQARQRRAAAQAQAQQSPRSASVELPPASIESDMDLGAIDVQTRRLLRSFVVLAAFAGSWLIWIDVLPALGVFDRWKLWPYTVEVSETPPAADSPQGISLIPKSAPSTATPTRVTQTRWITLKDVMLGAIVVLMTAIAARNVPGLLEIALLQRLPLDPGGRYAIATVCKYLIVLAGIVAAFWQIGIGWTNVQWLAAAITVGLGFGLQEIFSNFISGLIILFERPMRVGDTVTVGGVSGTVTRIRIRATTITDADRKELIVPNREFITGQLVNWTLTDNIVRTVVKVGIAYGSDVALARKLLLRVAQSDPRIVADPPAQAVFQNFGESTLDFELRVFSRLDQSATLRDDLNSAINQAFEDAGIEIPFPQREVRVRSDAPGTPLLEHVHPHAIDEHGAT